MKILYLSCHETLEFDTVKLFHEMGHQVFSPGSFVELLNRGDGHLRPSIPGLVYDPDIVQQWHKLAGRVPGQDAKDHLTKEFVDNFDTVIVMHLPRWIENNWQAMLGKRVIWQTIGQSISHVENQLRRYRQQGMQIVRYSPMERNIPGYIGEDALIRFYKDPTEYIGWTGETQQVITFGQSMKARGAACNFPIFEQATRPFPRKLFGPGNEDVHQQFPGLAAGKVSSEQQIIELRSNRVYFYTGTHPASYTLNFIESLMTGVPLVCIGSAHGNAAYFKNHNLYEIPAIIQNHYNGFISDNVNELQACISQLLQNISSAKLIGMNGRATAIKLFGKPTIQAQWKAFLGD
jgi:hypothetical protein